MAPRKLTLDDYIITTDGKVINKITGHEQALSPNNKGYLRARIGGKYYFVHRLVAELYIPNPENKPQVNHIDGNKLNNSVENLEWVSNDENRTHAVDLQLHAYGERVSSAKLNWDKVNYIRSHTNMSNNELAQMFGVTPRTIRLVKNYQTWKTR